MLSPQRWAHPHWSLGCALHGRLQTIYALGSSEPPVLCPSVPFSTLSFPSSLPWLVSVSCSDAPQAVSGTGLRHLQGPLQVQCSLNKLLGYEHFFPHRIHPLSGWAPLLDFLPGSWQGRSPPSCHEVEVLVPSISGSIFLPSSPGRRTKGVSGEPIAGHQAGPAASEGAKGGGARYAPRSVRGPH